MLNIDVQFVSDKKNKRMVQNKLKSFTKCNLLHLGYFPYTLSVIPLYSHTNIIDILSYVFT